MRVDLGNGYGLSPAHAGWKLTRSTAGGEAVVCYPRTPADALDRAGDAKRAEAVRAAEAEAREAGEKAEGRCVSVAFDRVRGKRIAPSGPGAGPYWAVETQGDYTVTEATLAMARQKATGKGKLAAIGKLRPGQRSRGPWHTSSYPSSLSAVLAYALHEGMRLDAAETDARGLVAAYAAASKGIRASVR